MLRTTKASAQRNEEVSNRIEEETRRITKTGTTRDESSDTRIKERSIGVKRRTPRPCWCLFGEPVQ